ncbi:MAG: RDD family protein [Streptosporangiaceae bacterium]|nr:RDD family protein [Streptosporangiaceae bacterium]MBV9854386.1 RDD family protein [Streptosporangiaceae bacterium]
MTNHYDPQDDRLPSYGEAGHGQAQQPGAYGQPRSGGYGPPPGTYGGPQPGAYGGPQPGPFAQPQPGSYGQPQAGPYGQPRQAEYGQSQQGYGSVPASGYGSDASQAQPYGAPPAGYGASAAGYQPAYGSPADYASWLTRVAATLVDSVPQLVLTVIAIVVLSAGKGSTVALLFAMLFYLSALGVAIYNRWIRAGRTGQSWGKQVVGVRLIDEETRQPIGALMAFVRDLAHVIDGLICYIGYLFPLWDQKRQTIADKIVHTVVVPADEPYSPQSAVDQRGRGAYPQATGQYPQSGYPGQTVPQGYPQQPGYPQGPGYSQGPGNPQGPGYPQGSGHAQGAAFPSGPQEPPYQYGQNNGRGPGYGNEAQRPGYPQDPGYPPSPGYGGQR